MVSKHIQTFVVGNWISVITLTFSALFNSICLIWTLRTLEWTYFNEILKPNKRFQINEIVAVESRIMWLWTLIIMWCIISAWLHIAEIVSVIWRWSGLTLNSRLFVQNFNTSSVIHFTHKSGMHMNQIDLIDNHLPYTSSCLVTCYYAKFILVSSPSLCTY